MHMYDEAGRGGGASPKPQMGWEGQQAPNVTQRNAKRVKTKTKRGRRIVAHTNKKDRIKKFYPCTRTTFWLPFSKFRFSLFSVRGLCLFKKFHWRVQFPFDVLDTDWPRPRL